MAGRLNYLVATLLLSASAHAEVRALYGGAAAGALSGQPIAFDPLSSRAADLEVAALIFDRLFHVDSLGVPRPVLVQSLDETQPLRPRLQLRPDLHFHDGRPLGAADVVASLRRGLADPGGWMLGPIVAVRTVGDLGVELELSRRAPDLTLLLSTTAASITPAGQPPNTRLVGSGPFVLAQRGSDGGLRLQPWIDAPLGRPYLDVLTLRAYASPALEAQSFDAGSTQVTHALPSSFGPGRHNPSTAVDGPQTLLGLLCLGPTVSAEVAAALAVGIDKERLRRQLREPSRAATSLAAPVLTGQPARPVPPPSARPIPPGHLTILVDRSRVDERAVADRLLYELDRLGMEASIDAADPAMVEARRRRGDFQLLLTTVAPPVPDAGLQELAALAVIDPAAARKTLARAVATVGVSSPRLIPLYHRSGRVQISAELRGMVVDATGRALFEDLFWLRPRREARP